MLEIINYVLAALMGLVFCAWIVLIKTMIKDYFVTPRLDDDDVLDHKMSNPKVSIILPARNERDYIQSCLESLAKQDYNNYEIIAIDDSSEDETAQIISKMSQEYKNIILVNAGSKPAGWVGKNWPCVQGRKCASGDLLMFTDADTVHSQHALSKAVSKMRSSKLDAISIMPKLLSLDFLTSVTMPMITVFLNTVYSAAKVNDASSKVGYFYGSFFIIKAAVYDAIGGHEATRNEIVEDGVLGGMVKNSKYSMQIVSGTDQVKAVWARDRKTLWNALKRLMVPIALSNQLQAIGTTIAVGFLMLLPFVFVSYAAILWFYGIHEYILVGASMAASVAAFVGAAIDSKILHRNIIYALFAPIGGAMVTFGFFSGALVAKGGSVSWRNTKYSKDDCKKIA